MGGNDAVIDVDGIYCSLLVCLDCYGPPARYPTVQCISVLYCSTVVHYFFTVLSSIYFKNFLHTPESFNHTSESLPPVHTCSYID